MAQPNFNTIDKAVMAISGALMLTGIVVLGLIELLDGAPHAPIVTNQAGEVVGYGTFHPEVRTALVMAGVVLLGLYGLYKVATPDVGPRETGAGEPQTH